MKANDEPQYIRVRMDFLGSKAALIPVHLAAADGQRRVIELR